MKRACLNIQDFVLHVTSRQKARDRSANANTSKYMITTNILTWKLHYLDVAINKYVDITRGRHKHLSS